MRRERPEIPERPDQEAAAPEPEELQDLDDALAGTFPASDPVSAITPER
ncbi:MAG TPA: hypothetical protein VFQ71_10350 [Gaiellales bacterium]|jgi:hypothetical protein|nr:hypothetical protein [Gaiellales bacterium]